MDTADDISREELQLAARNHGFPSEALAHDVTPIGLHYLLIHYDIPVVDETAWCLTLDGCVDRPLRLSLDDLASRPALTQQVTMECAGNGRTLLTPRSRSQPWVLDAVGTGAWTGTPLAPLLREAGVTDDAVEILFTGLDRGLEDGEEQVYERSLTLAECDRAEVVVAYALNGAPLPPQHGFPARLLVPGWYGMTSVKWLDRITAIDAPFTGYQQARAYRLKASPEDPGTPVERIAVRSLLQPPGIPDFFTRARVGDAGPITLTGRAWSGDGPVTRVQVSTDNGGSWTDAQLHPAAGPHAWHRFTVDWEATPGEHVLCSRATDAKGATQPLEPAWNLGGYANNAIHRVPLTVRA
jgi:DMSO/TMAO reductase YedYZ molybdopterin-dependent catalytic subunit